MKNGFTGGVFDLNRDGKMDAFERTAESQFLDEVVFSNDSSDEDSDDLDEDENSYISTPAKIYPNTLNQSQQTPHKEQESNRATILKSLLAIGIVIGAFALCLSGEMGQLGMGLLLIGAAFAGYFILKK